MLKLGLRLATPRSVGRPLLADAFAGASGAPLSAFWTAQLGAFELDGAGHVRGKALAPDGINLIGNGEFTTSTSGWSAVYSATLTRRDFASDPNIAPTGGLDDWGLEVRSGGDNGSAADITNVILVSGMTVTYSARAYSPSSNVTPNAAVLQAAENLATSQADQWQTLSKTMVAFGDWVRCRCKSANAGDVAYFDAVNVQAHYAIATCDPGSPNVEVRVPVTMPASGSVPFGIVARYQDAANYWLWRIRPNRGYGNDFELIQMAAGVATQRAAARVAWGAGATYNLTLRHSAANVYTALVDGAATLSYTDGAGFAADQTLFGLLEAKAANGLFGRFEVWPL